MKRITSHFLAMICSLPPFNRPLRCSAVFVWFEVRWGNEEFYHSNILLLFTIWWVICFYWWRVKSWQSRVQGRWEGIEQVLYLVQEPSFCCRAGCPWVHLWEGIFWCILVLHVTYFTSGLAVGHTWHTKSLGGQGSVGLCRSQCKGEERDRGSIFFLQSRVYTSH